MRLEFDYARRLRAADAPTRRALYEQAYSEVARHRPLGSADPEERTAGTSAELVGVLLRLIDRARPVLEVGCGRGYTCAMLAPRVPSIVGTDVAESALAEAQAQLDERGIRNASVANVSALELAGRFSPGEFGTAISIQVIEHLHPDDAEEHLRQVYRLLGPGGRYVFEMPNRLSGPHDITRAAYPRERRALGFHLNESTYRDMTRMLRRVGFREIVSYVPLRARDGGRRPMRVPCAASALAEAAYVTLRAVGLAPRRLKRLVQIRLIAQKPA